MPRCRVPDLASFGHTLSVWFLPVILAITLHEAAHAWAAWKLGDDTAKSLGRLSFNPIRHIDPVGTFVIPALMLIFSGGRFMFGWAKPVPVAFHRLRNPKRDMIWVAGAGPLINIALATAALLLMHGVGQLDSTTFNMWIWENLKNFVDVNIIFACFNMLPILPLDGGRILTGLLPLPLAVRFLRTERYGILIVLGLFFIAPLLLDEIGIRFSPLELILFPMYSWVLSVLAALTGW